jgi:pimeloyl-ACP methyl ester carboxylesterase
LNARVLALVLALPLLLYGALCAFVFANQESLLFPGRPAPFEAERAEAARDGLAPWTGPDGAFWGWKRTREGASTRVLVIHGNGGSAWERASYGDLFPEADLYLLEYPGYGARPGRPTRASLREAAAWALASLPGPATVVGESLGTGLAAELAAAEPGRVRALLLVTPYDRLLSVARHHYPYLPGFLLRHDLDTAAALSRFPGAVAVVLAGRDEVIPPELGRRAYEAAMGPKGLWTQAEAGHNTVDLRPGSPSMREVTAFLAR